MNRSKPYRQPSLVRGRGPATAPASHVTNPTTNRIAFVQDEASSSARYFNRSAIATSHSTVLPAGASPRQKRKAWLSAILDTEFRKQ